MVACWGGLGDRPARGHAMTDTHRCDRCGEKLRSGAYYDVTLEVKSDAEPLELTPGDLRRDTQQEIDELVDQMRDMDPASLEADVYKLMKFRICRSCQQVVLHDPLQRKKITPEEWPEFDVDDFLESLNDSDPANPA